MSLRSEHAKRSPNCAFLHMKKTFDKLTAIEYFQLEQERLRIYIVSVNAVVAMIVYHHNIAWLIY